MTSASTHCSSSPLECCLNYPFMQFCKLFFTFYCPLTVYGKENIPDQSFMLCSNHSSHMDSAALMHASGLPFKQWAMVAAQDYFFYQSKKQQLLRLLMNLIPIERKASRASLASSVQACQAFIKQNIHPNHPNNLIIYPEGTRSLNGELQSFKNGPAWIALKLNIPIIPAYIQGTFESLPKGRCFPTAKPLRIFFGKPLYPGEYKQHRRLTLDLQQQVSQLKEQAHASD